MLKENIMVRVGLFEKVSFEQFKKDWLDTLPTSKTQWPDEELKELYDRIELPKRATKGSCGYDFKTYFDFNLAPNQTIKFPSGIKVKISDDWFLGIVPRSSVGFKYRVQLDNTIGIIDADYYNNEKNEGDIFVKLTNDGKGDKVMSLTIGEGFAQGIFIPYGITEDDNVSDIRVGGIGSTNAQQK